MIWGLMVPPLSQKMANFTNLGQGLSQKGGFFLILEPILRAGFSDALCLFGCCIFTILSKYYLKGRFLTKKALLTTMITIFNAELRYIYRINRVLW